MSDGTGVAEFVAHRAVGGRRFQPVAERLLDEDLRRLASSLPNAALGVRLIPEFPGANGIADLAVVVGEEGLRARLATDIPFLESLHVATVASHVPVRRSVSLQTVAQRAAISERQVTAVIRTLLRSGALRRSGAGMLTRHPALIPVGRLYTLEAKVADWKRAMAQATRYAQWSDAAAVVLLTQPRELDRAIERARSLDLGLAVGSRWIVRPRIRRGNAGARLLASELFAEAVDADARRNRTIGPSPAPNLPSTQTQRLSATA